MADDQLRAIVLEDDPDAALFMRIALERYGGMRVDAATTADELLAALRSTPHPYDVLVSDIQLPGRSGLEVLPDVRELDPTLPIMIVTAYPTIGHAVGALRESADEFLVKPVTATQVVERATELAHRARHERAASRQRVLAVGAHPDDVEIGVGATLAAHAAAGDELVILTLSGGERWAVLRPCATTRRSTPRPWSGPVWCTSTFPTPASTRPTASSPPSRRSSRR